MANELHQSLNTHVQNNVLKSKYPDRVLLCGSFDPRDEEASLDAMRDMMRSILSAA
jgi:hypothetical protein